MICSNGAATGAADVLQHSLQPPTVGTSAASQKNSVFKKLCPPTAISTAVLLIFEVQNGRSCWR